MLRVLGSQMLRVLGSRLHVFWVWHVWSSHTQTIVRNRDRKRAHFKKLTRAIIAGADAQQWTAIVSFVSIVDVR